ncbi:MAG: hypothetical protein L6R42_004651 [Xanthoria sp. 1 TBL-2021]|nr:MAG: hypothetical protein L6R42_004651 [Xanthoria sp. 1 TBL-2021]
MERPGIQPGNRPQRRATFSPAPPSAPPPQGYQSSDRDNRNSDLAAEPYPPTQYLPNPLLAAYSVSPPLPRLVDSRGNRPKQGRDTYGRQTTDFTREDSPRIIPRTHRQLRLRSPDVIVDDARYDSVSDDGADPNDNDNFDDHGQSGLKLQGGLVHPAEPSPYIETVERVHHSRFHGSTLDQEAVTAHLITEPQYEGSQSATPNLFEWM